MVPQITLNRGYEDDTTTTDEESLVSWDPRDDIANGLGDIQPSDSASTSVRTARVYGNEAQGSKLPRKVLKTSDPPPGSPPHPRAGVRSRSQPPRYSNIFGSAEVEHDPTYPGGQWAGVGHYPGVPSAVFDDYPGDNPFVPPQYKRRNNPFALPTDDPYSSSRSNQTFMPPPSDRRYRRHSPFSGSFLGYSPGYNPLYDYGSPPLGFSPYPGYPRRRKRVPSPPPELPTKGVFDKHIFKAPERRLENLESCSRASDLRPRLDPEKPRNNRLQSIRESESKSTKSVGFDAASTLIGSSRESSYRRPHSYAGLDTVSTLVGSSSAYHDETPINQVRNAQTNQRRPPPSAFYYDSEASVPESKDTQPTTHNSSKHLLQPSGPPPPDRFLPSNWEGGKPPWLQSHIPSNTSSTWIGDISATNSYSHQGENLPCVNPFCLTEGCLVHTESTSFPAKSPYRPKSVGPNYWISSREIAASLLCQSEVRGLVGKAVDLFGSTDTHTLTVLLTPIFRAYTINLSGTAFWHHEIDFCRIFGADQGALSREIAVLMVSYFCRPVPLENPESSPAEAVVLQLNQLCNLSPTSRVVEERVFEAILSPPWEPFLFHGGPYERLKTDLLNLLKPKPLIADQLMQTTVDFFKVHSNNLREDILKTPLSSSIACMVQNLLEAEIDSIEIVTGTSKQAHGTFSFRISALDHVKLAVETHTGTKWDWWPLSPPKTLISSSEALVRWNCSCGEKQEQKVPAEFASRLQSLIYFIPEYHANLLPKINHIEPKKDMDASRSSWIRFATKMDDIITGLQEISSCLRSTGKSANYVESCGNVLIGLVLAFRTLLLESNNLEESDAGILYQYVDLMHRALESMCMELNQHLIEASFDKTSGFSSQKVYGVLREFRKSPLGRNLQVRLERYYYMLRDLVMIKRGRSEEPDNTDWQWLRDSLEADRDSKTVGQTHETQDYAESYFSSETSDDRRKRPVQRSQGNQPHAAVRFASASKSRPKDGDITKKKKDDVPEEKPRRSSGHIDSQAATSSKPALQISTTHAVFPLYDNKSDGSNFGLRSPWTDSTWDDSDEMIQPTAKKDNMQTAVPESKHNPVANEPLDGLFTSKRDDWTQYQEHAKHKSNLQAYQPTVEDAPPSPDHHTSQLMPDEEISNEILFDALEPSGIPSSQQEQPGTYQHPLLPKTVADTRALEPQSLILVPDNSPPTPDSEDNVEHLFRPLQRKGGKGTPSVPEPSDLSIKIQDSKAVTFGSDGSFSKETQEDDNGKISQPSSAKPANSTPLQATQLEQMGDLQASRSSSDLESIVENAVHEKVAALELSPSRLARMDIEIDPNLDLEARLDAAFALLRAVDLKRFSSDGTSGKAQILSLIEEVLRQKLSNTSRVAPLSDQREGKSERTNKNHREGSELFLRALETAPSRESALVTEPWGVPVRDQDISFDTYRTEDQHSVEVQELSMDEAPTVSQRSSPGLSSTTFRVPTQSRQIEEVQSSKTISSVKQPIENVVDKGPAVLQNSLPQPPSVQINLDQKHEPDTDESLNITQALLPDSIDSQLLERTKSQEIMKLNIPALPPDFEKIIEKTLHENLPKLSEGTETSIKLDFDASLQAALAYLTRVDFDENKEPLTVPPIEEVLRQKFSSFSPAKPYPKKQVMKGEQKKNHGRDTKKSIADIRPTAEHISQLIGLTNQPIALPVDMIGNVNPQDTRVGPAPALGNSRTLSSGTLSQSAMSQRKPSISMASTQFLPDTPEESLIFLAASVGDDFRLSQIDVAGRRDDTFFTKLKREYTKLRGWRRIFSIWKYSHCDFSMFEKVEDHDITPRGERPSLPEDDDIEYSFNPRPAYPLPPISPHEFRRRFYECYQGGRRHKHWFRSCRKKCRVSKDALGRIPKRNKPVQEDGDKREIFWGLLAVEAISFVTVALYHIVFLAGPSAFWILWLTTMHHPGDFQNASVPFLTTLALISFFWFALSHK